MRSNFSSLLPAPIPSNSTRCRFAVMWAQDCLEPLKAARPTLRLHLIAVKTVLRATRFMWSCGPEAQEMDSCPTCWIAYATGRTTSGKEIGAFERTPAHPKIVVVGASCLSALTGVRLTVKQGRQYPAVGRRASRGISPPRCRVPVEDKTPPWGDDPVGAMTAVRSITASWTALAPLSRERALPLSCVRAGAQRTGLPTGALGPVGVPHPSP